MNMANGSTKSWVVNSLLTGWKESRGTLDFPQKSFNQLWKEKFKN